MKFLELNIPLKILRRKFSVEICIFDFLPHARGLFHPAIRLRLTALHSFQKSAQPIWSEEVLTMNKYN